MAIHFTQNGRRAVLWAQEEALRLGQPEVGPEHLLLGLIHFDDSGAIRLLDRLGVAGSQVRAALGAGQPTTDAPRPSAQNTTHTLSARARHILEAAHAEAAPSGGERVGTSHLLLALLRVGDGPAAEALGGLGLTYERAARAMGSVRSASAAAAPGEDARAGTQRRGAPGFLKGRDLLSVADLSPDEVAGLFDLTRALKAGHIPDNGRGKSLALIFEKPSLRTRVTFSVAMTRLGGQSIYLSPQDIGLGTRETVGDVARCLSRWVDAIAARTFAHDTVAGLAENADIPVINALTDREHPCQALADFYTILEHKAGTRGMKLVFVGDGNNVARSLLMLAPLMGTHFTLACPAGYEPPAEIVEQARALARERGTNFEISNDALAAADDADVLYTDVWASMGQEEESQRRARDFAAFQLNDELVREAKDDVLVLHCLPAHRGQEITDAVLDSHFPGVLDQAENRLHVQMALLAAVL